MTVRADVNLAVKSSCNLLKRTQKSCSSRGELISQLTHLYLQEKQISVIGDLSPFENVTVLYLQDNMITKIQNLEKLHNVKYLYLQNNAISRIENLNDLKQLEKLYLSNNKIAVVENLEFNNCLTELYVDNQNLEPHEQVLFEPKTLKSLANNLKVLDISNNNLESISDLQILTELTKLYAKNNEISNVEETAKSLCSMYKLMELNLISNPITKNPRYRKELIPSGLSLTLLDQKEISKTSKTFLRGLHRRTSTSKTTQSTMVSLPASAPTLSEKFVPEEEEAEKIIRTSVKRLHSLHSVPARK